MLGINRLIKTLYTTHTLRVLGVSLVDFFGVLFIYDVTDQDLVATVGVFAILYFLYSLFIPRAAQWYGQSMSRKSMMMVGMLALTASYLPFIAIPNQVTLIIALHLVFQALFRLMYWLPYQVSIAQAMQNGKRGRALAVLEIFTSIALGLSPLVGGFLIDNYGFQAMFTVGVIVLSLAIIPLFFVPQFSGDRFEIPYRHSFRILFSKHRLRFLMAHSAAGANHIGRTVFWPLFIFLLLDGQYATIGIISSAAMLVVIVLRLLTGHLLDKPKHQHRVVQTVSKLQALTWWLRALPVNAWQVFAADTAFRLVQSGNDMTYNKLVYDHLDQEEDRADEYIVIRVIALNLGRFIMLGAGLVIALWLGNSVGIYPKWALYVTDELG